MINCKSADGVDIVAMSTAYEVKCDVLELFYIDPTIIYIYCIAKMYGECLFMDEMRAVLR